MAELPDDGTSGAPRDEAGAPPPRISFAEAYDPAALEQIDRAPCGCLLSEVEQKHQGLDHDQRRRVRWLLDDLKRIRNGLRDPRLPTLLPPGDLTAGHIGNRWRYFLWLYAENPKSFPDHIRSYERAHDVVWAKPPCRRGVALLHPKDVEGLPLPSDDEPPRRRSGGRRRSAEVQQRNARIAALFVDLGLTYGVAKTLDDERYPIPATWAKLLPHGQQTWMGAMQHLKTKRLAEKFLSKQNRRARNGA